MIESEFNQLADAALARIEKAVDDCGGDVECNRSGNVLEIEFDNGQKIIVNRHDINREIWVAAKSGGFHYAWKDGVWHSQRDDSELFARLVELFAAQGEAIDLP
ncbi:MAG: iron donor protein CyaY [Gallionella sp.]|jgi:CyaY protein|nr:iron donor protein CyaY [Gallionella sp.]MCK9354222.1 iron donor protein CyaY [Gallionella sp.]